MILRKFSLLMFFIFFVLLFILIYSIVVNADSSSINGSFDPLKVGGIVFSNPYPSQSSWILPSDHNLNITVTNDNSSVMDVDFYWAGNDTLIGTDIGVNNGSVANVTVGFSYTRYHVYSWYVLVWSNQSVNFSFTGEAYDWDINRDAVVNYLDASSLTSHYGENPYSGREDITGDGKVNYLDASSLTYHYGESY